MSSFSVGDEERGVLGCHAAKSPVPRVEDKEAAVRKFGKGHTMLKNFGDSEGEFVVEFGWTSSPARAKTPRRNMRTRTP